MADSADKNPRNTRLEQAKKMAARKPVSTGDFFKEVIVELKKTSWPNRDVLAKSTTVVLALVLATGIFVFILDLLLGKVMTPLFAAH
jgi:preprotein translocase SecE subunit